MSPLWSLVFVILGGFVSAGTAYFLEKVRRRHQRRDKLDDARREALERTLAWIDPMERALVGAEAEIYGLLNGAHDEHEFRKRYPDLISDLKALDLSPHHRLVLDTDPYDSGYRISKALEELKYEALDQWEKTRYPVHAPSLNVTEARYGATLRVRQLREQVQELRQQLSAQYRKTCE
jgi:hypothetical protein